MDTVVGPRGMLRWVAALCIAWVAGGWTAAGAASLRVASAFDPQSMDPHAVALLYQTRVTSQVYESLVGRDEAFALAPALAVSWQQVAATAWRFRLRAGVQFHDGTPFTADDAVFSIQRAMGPTSQRAFQLQGVKSARAIDPLTLEIDLQAPDAVLPDKLFELAMMSKTWCQQHDVVAAQDFNGRQETYGVRHANGTGPFVLERYEPDVRTLLKRNARWWGWSQAPAGNLDDVTLLSIRSDATRLAALISGEVDLVLDPPLPDIERLGREASIRLQQVTDLGQQYLTFDQLRDQLEDSDVHAHNPFKDLRVRRAVYHALDMDLIVKKVLRGQAVPTGAFLSSRIDGSPAELDRRLPFDPALARTLLAQAGYPQGFSVTMDCVNVAWREAVCQAMTAMLTRVGIRASLRSLPTNQFFPKISQASASLIEFGWTPGADAWSTLNALFHTYGVQGAGPFNAGRYSHPALDAVIDALRVEPDLARRRAMVADVLRIVAEELPYIPLYRRTLTWAMARKVSTVQWPNDSPPLRWVRVQ